MMIFAMLLGKVRRFVYLERVMMESLLYKFYANII